MADCKLLHINPIPSINGVVIQDSMEEKNFIHVFSPSISNSATGWPQLTKEHLQDSSNFYQQESEVIQNKNNHVQHLDHHNKLSTKNSEMENYIKEDSLEEEISYLNKTFNNVNLSDNMQLKNHSQTNNECNNYSLTQQSKVIQNDDILNVDSRPHTNFTRQSSADPLNLNQYIFKNTIGAGTFGRVILVKNKYTNKFYALKMMAINEVARLNQIEHVKNEKNILLTVEHPFIVHLLSTTRDSTFLYLLFEFIPGGELFSYLRNAGQFSVSTTQFYASQLVLVLQYLHQQSVVYRDLKPENLLLDAQGHLKVTDFGFAKKLIDRTWTLCGTPEYLAPEIIHNKGHNRAVDWWALGILLFEMLCGYPPFYDESVLVIYDKILDGKVYFPKIFNPVVKDLIKKLLIPDRTKRLGSMKNGAEDVKNHKWFKDVVWQDVLQKRVIPPIIPMLSHVGDVRNFDVYEEVDLFQLYQPADDFLSSVFQDF